MRPVVRHVCDLERPARPAEGASVLEIRRTDTRSEEESKYGPGAPTPAGSAFAHEGQHCITLQDDRNPRLTREVIHQGATIQFWNVHGQKNMPGRFVEEAGNGGHA